MFEFRLKFHWNLFLKVQLTIHCIPALVQIMAWQRPGDKPLSEPIVVSLLMYICVTWPQWVNEICVPDFSVQHMPLITSWRWVVLSGFSRVSNKIAPSSCAGCWIRSMSRNGQLGAKVASHRTSSHQSRREQGRLSSNLTTLRMTRMLYQRSCSGHLEEKCKQHVHV